jgi:hypothetical protein
MTPQPVSTHGSYSPQVQKEISLGNRDYALKHFDKAAEHYGQASELQYDALPLCSICVTVD